MYVSRCRAWLRVSMILAAGAGVGGSCGCANPDNAVGFQEQDPAARIRAIRRAAETRDQASVPQLIDELSSDDPAERFLAIQALQQITGQTLGYDHTASPELRAEAVQRWAEWYSQRSETTKKDRA